MRSTQAERYGHFVNMRLKAGRSGFLKDLKVIYVPVR